MSADQLKPKAVARELKTLLRRKSYAEVHQDGRWIKAVLVTKRHLREMLKQLEDCGP